MRGLFTKESCSIQPGQAISGIADKAQTMRITSGRVWITVEGSALDYWLHAGDTFAVMPGRLIVIEADRIASRVDMVPNRHRSAVVKMRIRLATLLQRLAPGRRDGTVGLQRASA